MTSQFSISGPQICLEHGLVAGHTLYGRSGQITDIAEGPRQGSTYHFPEDHYLIPGLIDMHIHGAAGADVMDATDDALSTLATALLKEGTTAFLATTMTQTHAAIEAALQSVAHFQKTPHRGAAILGIHLEGPFLSAKRMGAQCGEMIIGPDIPLFDRWQKIAEGKIALVTVAPEMPGALNFIEHLVSQGVIASIGHTDASFEDTLLAIQKGATHATHLFNAMRGIHHREPGCIPAILMNDQVKTEVIADGVHLHPGIVKFIYQVKGQAGTILVTDAMRAKCLGNGVFDLGGQSVTVSRNEARLQNGTLAGSVLGMHQALKNMIEFTGIGLAHAVQLASANPAKALGCFSERGSIAVGKRADLVVLDRDFNVRATFLGGQLMYGEDHG